MVIVKGLLRCGVVWTVMDGVGVAIGVSVSLVEYASCLALGSVFDVSE